MNKKDTKDSSMQEPRDSLQGMTPDAVVSYMFQQFPIDKQLADGRRFPPIGCLRYSLVELLTKGQVTPGSKLSGLGMSWKSDRTEQ